MPESGHGRGGVPEGGPVGLARRRGEGRNSLWIPHGGRAPEIAPVVARYDASARR